MEPRENGYWVVRRKFSGETLVVQVDEWMGEQVVWFVGGEVEMTLEEAEQRFDFLRKVEL